jgi:hypothetical protein
MPVSSVLQYDDEAFVPFASSEVETPRRVEGRLDFARREREMKLEK